MPIRPEWRAFYGGAEWRFVIRPRILRRAGGRFDERGGYLGGAWCEQCGAPDRKLLNRVTGLWLDKSSGRWRGGNGVSYGGGPHFIPEGRLRSVYVVLTIAHLDHDPRNNGDDNLRALCQWCHLHYDAGFHKETRQTHKDARRPLLATCGVAAAQAAAR